jgi:hypothetical protein
MTQFGQLNPGDQFIHGGIVYIKIGGASALPYDSFLTKQCSISFSLKETLIMLEEDVVERVVQRELILKLEVDS